MSKTVPNQSLIITLYGFPGAGKTYFARQFCEHIQAAHIQGDRIRSELFEKPRYDKQENDVITQLMNYMSEEFLNAGISVIYDANAMRLGQRHVLREVARKSHAQHVLIWFQMDPDSAFLRTNKRDRRRADDKYAATYDRTMFNSLIGHMQNPTPAEDYIVVSGKHTFNAQFSTVVRRLRDLGYIHASSSAPVVKPGMVNLVPQPNMYKGRVDNSRRNIMIR
jgi:predicted kinase